MYTNKRQLIQDIARELIEERQRDPGYAYRVARRYARLYFGKV